MPSKPKLLDPLPVDVAAIIAKASLPWRPVPLCLNGGLQGDREVLAAELAAAVATEVDRMATSPEVADLQDRLTALDAEMRASTIVFRMRGLSAKESTTIQAEHPARDGDKGDADAGYNVEAFEREMVRKGCVWPELTPELWDDLDAKLTTWQRRQLTNACYALGFREVGVPFSLADLARSPDSAES